MLEIEAQLQEFSRRLLKSDLMEVEVAVGLLWMAERLGASQLSHTYIAEVIRSSGGPNVNASRLRQRLKLDSRVLAEGQEFKINVRAADSLEGIYREFSGPIRPKNSSSVLDSDVFANARKYTQSVVWQINASYDAALFDCCAVMCRRLFETLLIDAFDSQGQLELIRDSNGDILMLSGIIRVLRGQRSFNVGRQTKQASDKLKDIGDWSAHNRTFIARARHIDGIRDDLYLACADLLHLSGQD